MKRLFKQFGVCLGFLMLAQSVHAVPIFNNLSHSFAGYVEVQDTKWVAAKTNVGSKAMTIDNFVVKIVSFDTGAPLAAQVCTGNAGAPVMETCVPFAANGPISNYSDPSSFGEVGYSGSFPASANADVWIVLSTSTSGSYGWSFSTDADLGLTFSFNSGSSWLSDPLYEVLYSISGNVVPPPTPVPTLSEWALISFAIALAGFGVYQLRRRES